MQSLLWFLIVGAGAGFKEMLIATKISDLIGQWATEAHISALLLGWAAAAVARIATDSATVATITGTGIMAPIVQANYGCLCKHSTIKLRSRRRWPGNSLVDAVPPMSPVLTLSSFNV